MLAVSDIGKMIYFGGIKFRYNKEYRSRDSSVGIAIQYGLDGLGIESRRELDFPYPSRPNLGPHPASCTMGTESFPGVKWPGRGVDHPLPSSAEVKERVELYFYPPPSGPTWPFLR